MRQTAWLRFLSISLTEAACTWTDQADTAGNQADAVSVSGAVTSLDACKTHCDTIADCVAVEWVFPECKTYTTLTSTTSLSGRTYSIKTCVAGKPEVAPFYFAAVERPLENYLRLKCRAHLPRTHSSCFEIILHNDDLRFAPWPSLLIWCYMSKNKESIDLSAKHQAGGYNWQVLRRRL